MRRLITHLANDLRMWEGMALIFIPLKVWTCPCEGEYLRRKVRSSLTITACCLGPGLLAHLLAGLLTYGAIKFFSWLSCLNRIKPNRFMELCTYLFSLAQLSLYKRKALPAFQSRTKRLNSKCAVPGLAWNKEGYPFILSERFQMCCARSCLEQGRRVFEKQWPCRSWALLYL